MNGVAERLAEFVDGGSEAVLEVHESICGPDTRAQGLSRDEFAGAFNECLEQACEVRRQARLPCALLQLPCTGVVEDVAESVRAELWPVGHRCPGRSGDAAGGGHVASGTRRRRGPTR